MNSADRNIYKIVFLAGIFAVLIYFHRNSEKSDKVPYLDNVSQEKIKVVDTRVFETDVSLDTKHFKGRRLKWVNSGASHPAETKTTRNESTLDLGSGSGNSGDAECSDVHKLNDTQRCAFVNSTDDCQIDEGFIDYTYFVYCDFSPKVLPLALIILVLYVLCFTRPRYQIIWWLFLFIGLAVTADDFFCPSLAVISDTMRLSHNIAGVTFLAFGNGAPDIFSAIAAIGNAKNGDAGLAFGALFGAGVFVTTVVAGTIAIIQPFDAMQRPFLRDVIFFLAATFWAFQILWKKEITKFEAIGFILLYVFYVLVVVVGRYIHSRSRNRTSASGNVQESWDGESEGNHLQFPVENNSTQDSIVTEQSPLLQDTQQANGDPVVTEFIPSHDYGPLREFLNCINPIDIDGWSDKNMFKKIYEVFKCPLMFCLIVTVPVVNYEEEKHQWNRHLYCLQCFLGPLFGVTATKVGFNMLGGHFPVWALTLILGIVLAAVVFFTSKNDEQPKYHAAFAYLGFLIAVIWIYSIANEIVNILQTFGVVFSISNAILGLTLLAWGNSLGDFIADTVMARQGFPRMGISACFGGPLFNLLLGVGIPFTIATIKNGGAYQLKITLEEVVLAGFVCLSLISSLLIVPLSRFRMSRPWGIYLVVLYVIFLVVAILTETGVIHALIDGNTD